MRRGRASAAVAALLGSSSPCFTAGRPTTDAAGGCSTAALFVASARYFNSGLDPIRQQRLKLSGITFNRPRGRDTHSDIFERKVISLVEASTSMSIAEGITEGTAIVDLTCPGALLSDAEPSHEALRDETMPGDAGVPTPLLPASTPEFDAQALVPFQPTFEGGVGAVSRFLSVPSLPNTTRRNLRRNADSWPSPLPTMAGSIIIHAVDPDLRAKYFRREEAQVEMMTAYRNILCDAAEWTLRAKGVARPDGTPVLESSYVPKGALVTPIKELRMPPLCLFSAGDHLAHDLPKLNQQALVKGFHRCPNHIKDWICANAGSFRVRLYVPAPMMPSFARAFGEAPWEAPGSIWDPGRTALYPGLPVPKGLLKYEGWVGKREEIAQGERAGLPPAMGRMLTSGASSGNADDTPYDAIRNASARRDPPPPPPKAAAVPQQKPAM